MDGQTDSEGISRTFRKKYQYGPENEVTFTCVSKIVFAGSDHAEVPLRVRLEVPLSRTTSLAHDSVLSLNSSKDEVPKRTGHQTLVLRPGDLTLTTVTKADERNNNEMR
jgi:hypothetical protein